MRIKFFQLSGLNFVRHFTFVPQLYCTTVDVCYQNQTKSLDFAKESAGTRSTSINQPTKRKVTRRTPFSEAKWKSGKKYFMTRDSLSFLMLFLLLSHNPISLLLYVLSLLFPRDWRMCECEVRCCWCRSERLYHQKIANLCRAPSAIKNEIYLNDETHGWRIIVEPELKEYSEKSSPAKRAMRRALTFLLIFTYQIMSVVFIWFFLVRFDFPSHPPKRRFVGRCRGMMEETERALPPSSCSSTAPAWTLLDAGEAWSGLRDTTSWGKNLLEAEEEFSLDKLPTDDFPSFNLCHLFTPLSAPSALDPD